MTRTRTGNPAAAGGHRLSNIRPDRGRKLKDRRALPIGPSMNLRRAVLGILLFAVTLIAPASALAGDSTGTPEQIAWVRRAATNFVTAELTGNAAGACAILNAPLRATRGHRTCEQRWKVRLATVLGTPAARARMRAQRREIATSAVVVRGRVASLSLKTPLINGPNHFLWTEMCWMLEG